MRILFIHQAFPAQFGRLGLELTRRYGWRCEFLVEGLSACPSPSREMLDTLELRRIPRPGGPRPSPPPWPQIYGSYLELCGAVFEAVRERGGPPPDLVVAHGGRGAPTLFLPDLLDCPIVNYCEYYFANRRRDLTYRIDLPPAEPAPFFPRCINAPTLVGLLACDAGYSPTSWQRDSFPERFRPGIEVHFDGLDTELYRPRRVGDEEIAALLGGRSVGPSTRVVTFVARGLESIRGFDLFLQVAARIASERPDVLFVVVGRDEVYYGWDKLHTGQPSFKAWASARVAIDPGRLVFLDHVEPERLAGILARSDLHLYPSAPFVTSWSLFDAMAAGCVVLASDVAPVREVIEPGVHGLVEPLYDTERWVRAALRVLERPSEFHPLGRQARARMVDRFGLDVAIPGLKDYFERIASRGRRAPGRYPPEVGRARSSSSGPNPAPPRG